MRNVLANRPDLSREQLERTRALMDAHVRDCLVTGFEHLIPVIDLPDPDDRHVVAAAVHCGASLIVTALPCPISVSTSSSRRSADVGMETERTAPLSSWKSMRWVSARVCNTVDSTRPDSRASAMSSADGKVLGITGAFMGPPRRGRDRIPAV
jgi:hypothetical protein